MERKDKPVVVGIGEILWDMLPEGKRAGGAPINFVYNATQLGANGYAISAIGDDEDGREIIRELDKNHINHQIQVNQYPTSKVLVQLDNGIPSYTIVEDVAWDYLQARPEDIALVKKADAVCYGSLALRSPQSRTAIKTLLANTNPAAIKLFDINLRQHYYSSELIDELLTFANIFKINDEEFAIFKQLFNLDGDDEEICRRIMQKYKLQYLIFTAGDKYSIIYGKTEKSYIPTPKVPVEDTVGSGDSFSGAFTYSILQGKSLQEAHQTAVKIAAFIVTQSGAWPKYPKELKNEER